MPQEKFHRGGEYVLYGKGQSAGRAWMELWEHLEYPTVPSFENDDVLMFWLKHGPQQNFFHDMVYELEGSAGLRTKVKYVHRRDHGNRTLLGFRRLRRRVRATV